MNSDGCDPIFSNSNSLSPIYINESNPSYSNSSCSNPSCSKTSYSNPCSSTSSSDCLNCHNLENQIKNCCGLTGITGNALCNSLIAGDILSKPPYTYIIDLIELYCNQGQTLTPEQKTAAYQAYVNTTGHTNIDLTEIVDGIANQGNNLANFNSFYMFMPTMILLVVAIWLLVGFKRINWVVGIFSTVFVIVILYSFSVAYRLNVQTYVRNRQNALNNRINESQASYQESIAYMPQSMFAIAGAIACPQGTGCWNCSKVESLEQKVQNNIQENNIQENNIQENIPKKKPRVRRKRTEGPIN